MNTPKWCCEGTLHKTNLSGIVEVIKYNHSTNIEIKFINTFATAKTSTRRLKDGGIKDRTIPCVAGVGFVGYGRYKAKINNKHTAQYSTWIKMIHRCYLQSSLKCKPSYIDCLVCDEWHNFQNFAEWFDLNYPNDGGKYELDKDLKIKGSQEYSPESCSFVSHTENCKARGGKFSQVKMINPSNEVVTISNRKEFCKEMGFSYKSINNVINGKQLSYKGWVRA